MPTYRAITGYHDGNPDRWEIQKLTNKIGVNDFIIGVEWEIELGGYDAENAKKISTAMNYCTTDSQKIIIGSDASLTHGMEVKTQPATYSFHRDVLRGYDWVNGMRKAKELGYYGEKNTYTNSEGREVTEGGHAGIHFNLDRQKLQGSGNVEHNILLLFINNQDWIMPKFSRRENTANRFQYCHWNEGEPKINPSEVRRNFDTVNRHMVALARGAHAHSSAINLEHSNVIEVRFIASTTHAPYFFAALQLMMMMCYCTRHMTLEEIAGVRFPWFKQCAVANGYTEFLDYCKVPRINITEDQFPY